MEYGFCRRCQQWRRIADPVTVIPGSVLQGPLRLTFLPKRCTVCLAAQRLAVPAEVTSAQTPREIDARLSIFDRRLREFATGSVEIAHISEIGAFVDESRLYTDRLKENGFRVGGREETIRHVACVYPEFFLSGYIKRFFFLLFLPITYWSVRYRRSRNPDANFFPLDYRRASRVILTNRRLVLYVDIDWTYYRYCSIPHEAIREVRQHGSSIRIQLHDRLKPTITTRVGNEVGTLLRAIHVLSSIRVRDPAPHWRTEFESSHRSDPITETL